MKYLFIICIFFFSFLPLGYADVASDRCNGIMMHDYTFYMISDVKYGVAEIDGDDFFKQGSQITDLLAVDRDDTNEDVEDFGSVNYAQYRDLDEYPAKYITLTDCHVEKSDKPPYYQLVANNPLEHFYQQHYLDIALKYNLTIPENTTGAEKGLDMLFAHKNSLCAQDWRFCFNVDFLIAAYPELKRACVNAAPDGLYDDTVYTDAFNKGRNIFDRNTGLVIFIDEFLNDDSSSKESSKEDKEQGKMVTYSCTYSLEEQRVIATHQD